MKAKKYVGILIMTVLLFLAHCSVPFMMDDEWYATNLATGEALQTFGDVLEGQVWHYNNWGGRSITHGILQLTIMTGELCADILNVLMTLLLAYMMCVVSNQRKAGDFLLALSLMLGLNANVKMSMFWQSGLVNYIYSTVWILVFLWAYLRLADNPEIQDLPFVTLWMIPLGFITGWSNENMGPTCLVLAVLVILYRKFVQKKQIAVWMYLGAVTALVGSALVILAPGNFVRKAAIEDNGFLKAVLDRFFSMFQAGADFLFPVCILIVVLMMIAVGYFKEKLRASQLLLLLGMILSYGAMVLSPHYPDRATFGTMILGVILIQTLLDGIVKNCGFMKKYINGLQLCCWMGGILRLTELLQ